MRRIMIFGATGFIGTELVKRLANNSHSHLILVLKPGDRIDIGSTEAKVTVVYVDVTFKSDLSQLNLNVDTIIYLCGTKSRDLRAVSKVYYEAPLALVEALPDKATTNFIFASNISVYGDQKDSIVTEIVKAQPNTPLGELIQKTEKKLMELSSWVTILRIPAVFGGDAKVTMPSAVVIDHGSNFMNFIWVHDLVSILNHLSQNPLQGLWQVSDNKPLLQRDAAQLLSKWWGRSPNQMTIQKAKKIFPINTFGILTNSVKMDSSSLLDLCEIVPLSLEQYILEEVSREYSSFGSTK